MPNMSGNRKDFGGVSGGVSGGRGKASSSEGPSITRGLPPTVPGPNTKITPGFNHKKQSPTGGQISYENGRMEVGPTQKEIEQQRDIIGAWNDYNNRGFWNKSIDVLAGPLYDAQMPNLDDPRTYWGGQYHTSTNPLASAAMLAGSVFGIPAAGLTVQGLQDITGFKTDVYHNPPPTANYGNEHYGMPGDTPAGMTGGNPSGPSGGNTGNGGGFGSFVMPQPPTSLTAGNGQLATPPSFGTNIPPGGAMQGPKNLAELLKALQQPTAPPGLGQFMGVI